MSSREYDDDPQEGAAHYVYTGEDRYRYHRGSWMYLIKTSWETIQIEAPYRPPDDPIMTFPPSPVHLYIMEPDETEVAEDLGVQTDWSVDLTCTQDEEMGPESITARHSPLGYPPRKMSPVPRATPQAKQCSGSRSPAMTRRTPSSAFAGRSLHPHPHLADGDQTRR